VVALFAATALFTGAVHMADPAGANHTTEIHINFQPCNAPAPAGYHPDCGVRRRGHAWFDYTRSAGCCEYPYWRHLVADERYDTTMVVRTHEYSEGSLSSYFDVNGLQAGTYQITIAAGDATLHGTTRVVMYQCTSSPSPPCPQDGSPLVLVNRFRSTAAQPFLTVTKTFTRSTFQAVQSDLEFSADPGLNKTSNGRWDFIDIVPVSG
jgi:hypothetical protein